MEAGVLKVTERNVKVNEKDGINDDDGKLKEDLLIELDRDTLRGAARIAIGNFLLKLQLYKASCNVEEATKLFKRYANVEEDCWIKWREIVLANKKPRKMFTQSNTMLTDDGNVTLKMYEANVDGLISSWAERFGNDCNDLYEAIMDVSKRDRQHFLQ